MAHCSESVEVASVSGNVPKVDLAKVVLLLFPCCGDNRLVSVEEWKHGIMELFSGIEDHVGEKLITLLVVPVNFVGGEDVVGEDGSIRRCLIVSEVEAQFFDRVMAATRFLGVPALNPVWLSHDGVVYNCSGSKSRKDESVEDNVHDGCGGTQKVLSPLFLREEVLSLIEIGGVVGRFDKNNTLDESCVPESEGDDALDGVFCEDVAGVEVDGD